MEGFSMYLLDSVEDLKESLQSYLECRRRMQGVLERDVESKAYACWILHQKKLQVRSKLFRSRTVRITEAEFDPDEERKFGASLDTWIQDGAMKLLGKALELNIATQRLVLACMVITHKEDMGDLGIEGYHKDKEIQFAFFEKSIALYVFVAQMKGLEDVFELEDCFTVVSDIAYRASMFCVHEDVAAAAVCICQHQVEDSFILSQFQPTLQDSVTILRRLVLEAESIPVKYNGMSVWSLFIQMRLLEGNLGEEDGFQSKSSDYKRTVGQIAELMSRVLAYVELGTNTMDIVQLIRCYVMRHRESVDTKGISKNLLLSYFSAVLGESPEKILRDFHAKDIAKVALTELTAFIFDIQMPSQDLRVLKDTIEVFPWNWVTESCGDAPEVAVRWVYLYVMVCRIVISQSADCEGINKTAIHKNLWRILRQVASSHPEDVYTICMLEAPENIPGMLQHVWSCIQIAAAFAFISQELSSARKNCGKEVMNIWEASGLTSKIRNILATSNIEPIVDLICVFVNDASQNREFISIANEVNQSILSCFELAPHSKVLVMENISRAIRDSYMCILDCKGKDESIAVTQMESKMHRLCCWLALILANSPIRGRESSIHILEDAFISIFQVLTDSEMITSHIQSVVSLREVLLQYLMASCSWSTESSRQTVLFDLIDFMEQGQGWPGLLALWWQSARLMCANHSQLNSNVDRHGFQDCVNKHDRVEEIAAFVLQYQEKLVSIASNDIKLACICVFLGWWISAEKSSVLRPLFDLEMLKEQLSDVLKENQNDLISDLLEIISTESEEEISKVWTEEELSWMFLFPSQTITFSVSNMAFEYMNRLIRSKAASKEHNEQRVSARIRNRAIEKQERNLQTAQMADFLAKSLSEGNETLNRWGRRGDKEASLTASAPTLVFQERLKQDIPQPLSDAQSHSWEIYKSLGQDLGDLNLRLRELVCQKYLQIDEKEVSETAEAYDEGECIPPQLRHRNHEHLCSLNRKSAFEKSIEAIQSKHIKLASTEFLKIELFMYVGAFIEKEGKLLPISKILTLLIQSLLFGTTPVTASNYVVGLVEQVWSLDSISIDWETKQHLVAYMADGLQGKDIEVPLAPELGVRILDMMLEPNMLLENDRLGEFFNLLRTVCSLCEGELEGKAAVMLSSFDCNRFGVLLTQKSMENPRLVNLQSALTEGTSKLGEQDNLSVSNVLAFAQNCLSNVNTSSCGVSILDGIILMGSSAYFSAVLTVILDSDHFEGHQDLLIKMRHLGATELSLPVISDSLRLVEISQSFDNEICELLAAFGSNPNFRQEVQYLKETGKRLSWKNKCPAWKLGVSKDTMEMSLVKISQDRIPVHQRFCDALRRLLHKLGDHREVSVIESRLQTILSSLKLSDLVAEYPSWGASWAWDIYVNSVRIPLIDLDAKSRMKCSSVVQSIWSQMPWSMTFFHLDNVDVLRSLRICLSDRSQAALCITQMAEWSQLNDRVKNAPNDQNFQFDKHFSSAMLAEIFAIVIHTTIILNDERLPSWMFDGLNLDFSLCDALMKSMDWDYFYSQILPSKVPGPWLLQPIVLCAIQDVNGVEDRIIRALSLLWSFARPEYETSVKTVMALSLPLMGVSVCQGNKVQTVESSNSVPFRPTVEVPEDFPRELLEGTLELEQLKLQDTEQIAEPTAGCLEVISISSCFKLSFLNHITIMKQVCDLVSHFQKWNKNNGEFSEEKLESKNSLVLCQVEDAYRSMSEDTQPTAPPPMNENLGAFLCSIIIHEPLTIIVNHAVAVGSNTMPWNKSENVFLTRWNEPPSRKHSLRSLRNLVTRIMGRRRRDEQEDGHDGDLEASVTDWGPLASALSAVVEEYTVHQTGRHAELTMLGRSLLELFFSVNSYRYNRKMLSLVENILRRVIVLMGSSNTAEESQSDISEEVARIAIDSSDRQEGSQLIEKLHFNRVSAEFNRCIASGMNAASLLEIANVEEASNHPLLITFLAMEAEKKALISEKFEWQALVVALLSAVRCSHGSEQNPSEIVILWLHALEWLNDTRWRRLPVGPHKEALSEFLRSLDAQVEFLKIPTEEISSGRYSGIRSRLESIASSAKNSITGAAISPDSELPGPTQSRLDQHPATVEEEPTEEELALKQEKPQSQRFTRGLVSFGKQLSNVGSRLTKVGRSRSRPPSDDVEEPASAIGQVSVESEPAGIEAQRLPSSSRIEYSADMVRIALAAYAVGAYIRSVMDPKLTRRTASADASQAVARHIRGTSMTGSRQIEEQQLQELDTVLEARGELDLLAKLEKSPALCAIPGLASQFFSEMPTLLEFGTDVATFQRRIIQILLPSPWNELFLSLLSR